MLQDMKSRECSDEYEESVMSVFEVVIILTILNFT